MPRRARLRNDTPRGTLAVHGHNGRVDSMYGDVIVVAVGPYVSPFSGETQGLVVRRFQHDRHDHAWAVSPDVFVEVEDEDA